MSTSTFTKQFFKELYLILGVVLSGKHHLYNILRATRDNESDVCKMSVAQVSYLKSIAILNGTYFSTILKLPFHSKLEWNNKLYSYMYQRARNKETSVRKS